MKKTLLLSALLSSALLAGDKYEVSALAGYNINDNFDDNFPVGAVELQYNAENSNFAPELMFMMAPYADYTFTRASSGILSNPGVTESVPVETSVYRLALNGVYKFASSGVFAKAGVGYESLEYERDGFESGVIADLGVGVKFPLSESFSVKAEAMYLPKFADSEIENNIIGLVGLTYSFGSAATEVAAADTTKDSDGDGVEDAKDQCIYTPAGAEVDENGCQLDSDRDGVKDIYDICPETPLGTPVDENGCPIKKNVDTDTDKDGVTNDMDNCPETPLGTPVDKFGCPHTEVLDIHFVTGSADITNSSAELNRFANFLNTYPTYKAHIVGHTDAQGTQENNYKLSLKRARAVVAALRERGVSFQQLSYEGKGELAPIASNETAQGRAQNRRIEAQITKN